MARANVTPTVARKTSLFGIDIPGMPERRRSLIVVRVLFPVRLHATLAIASTERVAL